MGHFNLLFQPVFKPSETEYRLSDEPELNKLYFLTLPATYWSAFVQYAG